MASLAEQEDKEARAEFVCRVNELRGGLREGRADPPALAGLISDLDQGGVAPLEALEELVAVNLHTFITQAVDALKK